jgi:hypothetical protein
MNDNRSAIEKVFEQLTDPWDWAAAGIGAAAGLGGTLLSHGLDGGTLAASGATAAVAARKALVTALQGKRLKKRANGLNKVIQEMLKTGASPKLKKLDEDFKREFQLWENDATSNQQFAKALDELLQKLRKI